MLTSALANAGYIDARFNFSSQNTPLHTNVFSYATDSPFQIVKVIDGDTVDISQDGVTTRVRLIGINSPESVDPRRPVECFGKQASAHAKELLNGKTVHIELDSTQDTYDKYGRLLAYITLSDGTLFNQAMIREGYAYEYTYDTPYKYQKVFKAAQVSARKNELGLWSPRTCRGTK